MTIPHPQPCSEVWFASQGCFKKTNWVVWQCGREAGRKGRILELSRAFEMCCKFRSRECGMGNHWTWSGVYSTRTPVFSSMTLLEGWLGADPCMTQGILKERHPSFIAPAVGRIYETNPETCIWPPDNVFWV